MWFIFNILGADGHFFPMVPLARELEAAGHEVTFVTGPDYCDRVERYGFTVLAVQDVVMTGAELKERGRSMSELRGNERVRFAHRNLLDRSVAHAHGITTGPWSGGGGDQRCGSAACCSGWFYGP